MLTTAALFMEKLAPFHVYVFCADARPSAAAMIAQRILMTGECEARVVVCCVCGHEADSKEGGPSRYHNCWKCEENNHILQILEFGIRDRIGNGDSKTRIFELWRSFTKRREAGPIHFLLDTRRYLKCFSCLLPPTPNTLVTRSPLLSRHHASRYRGSSARPCLGTEHIHVEWRLVLHGLPRRGDSPPPLLLLCLAPNRLFLGREGQHSTTPQDIRKKKHTRVNRLPLPVRGNLWENQTPLHARHAGSIMLALCAEPLY